VRPFEREVMRMKKVLTAVVMVGMILIPLAASATPAAPRARVAAPRAAAVTGAPDSSQATQGIGDRQICLNLDGDNRFGCILGGNPGDNCHEVFQITPLITYWRCGHITKPPTPAGCININGEHSFTCLGDAKPEGPCKNTFNLLFIHRYFCYGEGTGLLHHGRH
jgi:hypothetical protein